MTFPNNPMPDNPGDPDVTDEQNISPDEMEAQIDEAAADAAASGADADQGSAAVADGAVDADLQPELDDIDAELAEMVEGESAGATAGAGAEAGEAISKAEHDAAVAELTEDLQRLSAEYTNYRRRTDRERGVEVTRAKAAVVTELLPVLDELDMAAQHGHLEGPLKAFAEKLRGILAKQGLERFAEEGDEFNPDRHEAIQDLSSGDSKVLGTVVRPGYTFKDQLIRNAMVIIADPAENSAANSGENAGDGEEMAPSDAENSSTAADKHNNADTP